MWPKLAEYFAVEPGEYPGHATPLEAQMAADDAAWTEIVTADNLAEPDIGRLTSAWHTDADLGRPMEVMADMTKSRQLGFPDYQSTLESFTDLFDRLRRERLIPHS